MGCSNHKPVQHRDGKEPWCKKCGLTEDYRRPGTLFSEIEAEETTEETTIFQDVRDAETIEEAIAYTIGAASTLWSEEQKGEFLVDQANELGDALKDRIEVLVRDAIRTTMAMTVAKLKKG